MYAAKVQEFAYNYIKKMQIHWSLSHTTQYLNDWAYFFLRRGTPMKQTQ
jgi:hypothetical protein